MCVGYCSGISYYLSLSLSLSVSLKIKYFISCYNTYCVTSNIPLNWASVAAVHNVWSSVTAVPSTACVWMIVTVNWVSVAVVCSMCGVTGSYSGISLYLNSSPVIFVHAKITVFVLYFFPRAPSSPPGFSFKGISDYLHSFRSGNLTPTQVAENVIQALENSDQSGTPLRAIVQWEREQILKMAAASTVRYRDGKPLSVLDGIPVCLKESIRVVPYFCRGGTAYLGTRPEEEDAAVTKKLREAGAVIIGLANMHELGIGTLGCNPNKFHGTARNPYSPQHYPGGSSSGSAVAVAAGLCPLAIGTDGGGSIRIPSSFCGVVGLKGTFGRISDHGTLPVSYSTVSIGPMCSSVLDTAVAFAMLAGPDPKYPYGLQQPPLCFDGIFASDLKGVKLGIDWDFFKVINSVNLPVIAFKGTMNC
nr:PREDICTED: fatty acid amide hydrolase-like [Latimeria chalumnae]|eukprot:XP_005993677.2 PREDICTED: fatty acid amide hydrolase-like [Latimeria chalumnae]